MTRARNFLRVEKFNIAVDGNVICRDQYINVGGIFGLTGNNNLVRAGLIDLLSRDKLNELTNLSLRGQIYYNGSLIEYYELKNMLNPYTVFYSNETVRETLRFANRQMADLLIKELGMKRMRNTKIINLNVFESILWELALSVASKSKIILVRYLEAYEDKRRKIMKVIKKYQRIYNFICLVEVDNSFKDDLDGVIIVKNDGFDCIDFNIGSGVDKYQSFLTKQIYESCVNLERYHNVISDITDSCENINMYDVSSNDIMESINSYDISSLDSDCDISNDFESSITCNNTYNNSSLNLSYVTNNVASDDFNTSVHNNNINDSFSNISVLSTDSLSYTSALCNNLPINTSSVNGTVYDVHYNEDVNRSNNYLSGEMSGDTLISFHERKTLTKTTKQNILKVGGAIKWSKSIIGRLLNIYNYSIDVEMAFFLAKRKYNLKEKRGKDFEKFYNVTEAFFYCILIYKLFIIALKNSITTMDVFNGIFTISRLFKTFILLMLNPPIEKIIKAGLLETIRNIVFEFIAPAFKKILDLFFNIRNTEWSLEEYKIYSTVVCFIIFMRGATLINEDSCHVRTYVNSIYSPGTYLAYIFMYVAMSSWLPLLILALLFNLGFIFVFVLTATMICALLNLTTIIKVKYCIVILILIFNVLYPLNCENLPKSGLFIYTEWLNIIMTCREIAFASCKEKLKYILRLVVTYILIYIFVCYKFSKV